MIENSGGPAFPAQPTLRSPDEIGYEVTANNGMTLRDYFAAKAMQGICTQTQWENFSPDDIARWAYYQADAMLRAREA